ncbi:GNAT family N-acetyltransferase [Niallia circulans]|jgi:RimJ/RimL family protein N-acetyltransferase|uniref:GNAT family N-acetyltransferase n=1 Tax=Niallia circulans TaxID=1397 RepID=UPI000BA54DDE|nr:GNAT family N-acetyltransferase [Niallia circulans]PAD24023.1 GNAT family N-acetyltransferase [Niallia circulans]PAD87620.1 GNAT family N-acetyltransferase [Niallia circulans]
MEIRQLRHDDAEAYFALRLEALQINPEAFGSSYEEEKDYPLSRTQSRLSDPASYVYGAFVEKDLVGVVTLMRETKIKMSHRANIYAVYVTPKRRGKGVAKQLLKATIEKSRDLQGIEQVYLAVVAENTAAKKVYRAFGFETYGIDRKAIKINGKYYDEELMVLYL